MINVHRDEPVIFQFSIETSKCSGICNKINYPYAITTYFVHYNWSLIKNNVSCIKFGTHKETKIW